MGLVKYEDLKNHFDEMFGWHRDDFEKVIDRTPRYLDYAYGAAGVLSHDPDTQVGAIMVCPSIVDGPVIGTNSLVKGMYENLQTKEYVRANNKYAQRPLKYTYMEHAERKCIYHAAADGVPTKGAILFCPYFSCSECSRAIIESEIKMVIGHKKILDMAPDRWRESIKIGREMFDAAGVIYCEYEKDLDMKESIKFDGKDFFA